MASDRIRVCASGCEGNAWSMTEARPSTMLICCKNASSAPEATGNDSRVFFFQAEDGIRDLTVTGVQTCALPICEAVGALVAHFHQVLRNGDPLTRDLQHCPVDAAAQNGIPSAVVQGCFTLILEIGRASCRERV